MAAHDLDAPLRASGMHIREPNEMSKMTGVSINNKARDPMTISALSPSKMLANRSGLNISSGMVNGSSIAVGGSGI